MPPGSQAQADVPHPGAWHRSQMASNRTVYSFAEPDHPVSKLTRLHEKGEAWKNRIELWIEDVEAYWPIADAKVTAAMLKEVRELGDYFQNQLHPNDSVEKDGGRFPIRKVAAGTKEDPIVVD